MASSCCLSCFLVLIQTAFKTCLQSEVPIVPNSFFINILFEQNIQFFNQTADQIRQQVQHHCHSPLSLIHNITYIGLISFLFSGTTTIGIFVIGGIKSFGILLMEFGQVYQISKSQLTLVQSITGFSFYLLSKLSNKSSTLYVVRIKSTPHTTYKFLFMTYQQKELEEGKKYIECH